MKKTLYTYNGTSINPNIDGDLYVEDSYTNWTEGSYINSSGGVSGAPSWKSIVQNVEGAKKIKVKATFDGAAAYAFLDDASGNHLLQWNNTSFSNEEIDLSIYPSASVFKCSCRSANTSSLVVLAEKYLTIHKYEQDEELEGGGLEFLARIKSCDFVGRAFHFSFDDVCWCLHDLIQNKNTYTSIYDQPFFAMLKEVHDETGMVFTLNTFNTITTNASNIYPTGYDISNVPNNLQTEFQQAKGWLKFAFHQYDEVQGGSNSITLTVNEFKAAYQAFVSAIYTLTGDYECIDRYTRLGFFSGSLPYVLAIKNVDYGIKGLWGADDTRSYDYYLTSEQYSILRSKGKYIDTENNIVFIKTQYRTFATGKANVAANPCYQKVTEFFQHEYEGCSSSGVWNLTNMKNALMSLGGWATEQGYFFAFISNLFEV